MICALLCDLISLDLTVCFMQLGDGTKGTSRSTPVDVSGLNSGVMSVALGQVHLLEIVGCIAGIHFVQNVALGYI